MHRLVPTFAFCGCLVLCGCGGSGSGNPKPVVGTFVASGPEGSQTFVAIDAEPPLQVDPPGSQTSLRRLSAYATNGNDVSEFFSGTINGNIFDLVSDKGDARLTGSIDSFGVSANLKIGSSPAVTYDATAATGSAGLFTVTLTMPTQTADGSVSGSAFSGFVRSATLAGTITNPTSGTGFPVSGTITPTGGTPVNFTATLSSDSSGQQRWIVTQGGLVLGGPVTGSGAGFVFGRLP